MEKTVKVELKDGIDADVVSLLVQKACKYDSRIYLSAGTRRVNMKSIMGMMNMVVARGGEVVIAAEGSDEEAAVNDIESMLKGE
ncbi:MAG: HPr family phosphocarrier protein [Lachnospiraceae bacterium]|nr:HPr family phosphocarrier protein [Lachnospiraceae bacterium]